VFTDKKISRHHDGRFLFSRFYTQLRAQLNAYYARLYEGATHFCAAQGVLLPRRTFQGRRLAREESALHLLIKNQRPERERGRLRGDC
jgi:hypothetical protein